MIAFLTITWQERQAKIAAARDRIEKAEAKRREAKRARDAKLAAKKRAKS